MLRWRLLSASIIISIAVALAWLDYKQVLGAPPGAWMMPLYLTLLCLGTHEMLTMFANKGWHPVRWPVYVGVMAVAMGACNSIWIDLYGKWWHWLSPQYQDWLRQSLFDRIIQILLIEFYHPGDVPYVRVVRYSAALVITLLFAVELRQFNETGKSVIQIALGVLTIFYLGLLGSFFAELRFFHFRNELGMTALLSMILIVKMSDAGAYVIGRLLGRNKLAPKLSPGKTYEGALGGLLSAGFASYLFFTLAAPYMMPEWEWKKGDPGTYVCYGILLGSVGIIGDLAESMIKREMGVKDSGNTLPGIGGVLDVLDSLLFAAPVAYVCWELGLLGR